jgi:hypothetical protein
MRKLALVLIGLLVLGTFSFAQEVTVEQALDAIARLEAVEAKVAALEASVAGKQDAISGNLFTIGGSSTLKWRWKQTLVDNTKVKSPAGGFSTDDSGKFYLPNTWSLSLSAADADGNVIVKAESKITQKGYALMTKSGNGDNEWADTFQYIEFPNVIPGVLGVKLNKEGNLSTSVTGSKTKSATKDENILVTISPVDLLTVKLGLVLSADDLNEVTPATAAGDATEWYIYYYDETSNTVETDTVSQAEYDAAVADGYSMVGDNSTDAVDRAEGDKIGTSVAFGASLEVGLNISLGDTGSIKPTIGTIIDTGRFGTVTDVVDGSDTVEDWLPYTGDDAYTGTDKVYNAGAILPLGIGLDVSIADLSLGVDYIMVLTRGFDSSDLDSSGDAKAFAPAMYLGADVGYNLAIGDTMAIKPALEFKMNTDYWKWTTDGNKNWKYNGLAKEAAFLGRMMSLGIDLPVTGIAGILDITVGADFGLGPAAPTMGTRTEVSGATADEVVESWVDDEWDNRSNTMAMQLAFTVKAEPVNFLMIQNKFTYDYDGMGIVGAGSTNDGDEKYYLDSFEFVTAESKVAALYGSWMSRIKDVLTVEYYIMPQDSVQATIYAEGTLQALTDQALSKYADPSVEAPAATGDYLSSKVTFGYEIGAKCTVKF